MVAFADHLTAVAAEHRARHLARAVTHPALTAADYEMTEPYPDRPDLTRKVYPLPTGAAASGIAHLPLTAPGYVPAVAYDRPSYRTVDDSPRRTAAVAAMSAPEPVDYAAADAFIADGHEMHDRDAVAMSAAGARVMLADDSAPDPVDPAPVRHLYRAPGRTYTYCAQAPGLASIAAPDNTGALAVLTADGRTCELCIASCADDLAPDPVGPVVVDDPAATVAEMDAYAADAAELRAEMLADAVTVGDDDPGARPVAPVDDTAPVATLTAVPAPAADGRPTCPRCGQTFRKSGAGLAWHVANRPDCAPVAPALSAVG
jgi:hypothetical protein